MALKFIYRQLYWHAADDNVQRHNNTVIIRINLFISIKNTQIVRKNGYKDKKAATGSLKNVIEK